MVEIIHIVGVKNSGKTYLMERLLPALISLNLKVGTIKHDAGAHFDWDREGKDTHKFAKSGSLITSIVGDKQLAVKSCENLEISLNKLVETFYSNMDLVLVEGFGRLIGKKLEKVREPLSDKLLSKNNELIATVGDNLFNLSPHFKIDEITHLAEYIKKNLL